MHLGCVLVTSPLMIHISCELFLAYRLFGLHARSHTDRCDPNALSHHGHNMLNLLKPTGHVMHQQFNIQQLYALPTLYLCVLYLSENKQRLVPLTA